MWPQRVWAGPKCNRCQLRANISDVRVGRHAAEVGPASATPAEPDVSVSSEGSHAILERAQELPP